jgi:hypothetical protein
LLYWQEESKGSGTGQTIDLLLAAVNNHLDSAFLCEYAVLALCGVITTNDNKITKLILRSGGVTAAIKVREQWPNRAQWPKMDALQHAVHMRMYLLLKELNA